MSNISHGSSENRKFQNSLRTAIKRLHEGDEQLKLHREFINNGGEIVWIIDTDVVHFYLNPTKKARYAEVFPAVDEGLDEDKNASVAIAALLADFIFSNRFQITEDKNESEKNQKILLNPHTEEFDAMISAISRTVVQQARQANTAVNGQLTKDVTNLVANYSAGKEDRSLSPAQYSDKLIKIIGERLSIIFPNTPLNELTRARELLKDRVVLSYQADVEQLHAQIEKHEFKKKVDEAAEIWFDRMHDFYKHLDVNRSEEDIENARPGQAVRNHRDAKVLATIEMLNKSAHATRTRYVLISGQGALRQIANPPHKKNSDIFICRPWDFLGNPRLFSIDEVSRPQEEHAHLWKRLTQAMKLLTEDASSSDVESIRELYTAWDGLKRMAIPHAPRQATAPDIRKIAADIFAGKSLDALETELYRALSEFFVVSAELGLSTQKDVVSELLQRKPPPLRIAAYPKAETFIDSLISKKIWKENGETDSVKIAQLIKEVKAEQKSELEGNQQNFNYPLLLCLASRFEILGDWHAARLLASYAKSVAEVTKEALPFVTGREAALLESYCRRVDAKTVEDIKSARLALDEFKIAIIKEKENWTNPLLEDTRNGLLQKLKTFNPDSEFPLHDLRADSDELILEFTETMFGCFTSKDIDVLNKNLYDCRIKLYSMLDKSTNCLERLDSLKDLFFTHEVDTIAFKTLNSIQNFLRAQLELCALQCVLFLIGAKLQIEDDAVCATWFKPEVLKRLEEHGTLISKRVAYVAKCISANRVNSEGILLTLTALSAEGQLPYDVFRNVYLENLAKSYANAS